MSHFVCEHCGTVCYDTHQGYVTGCEHYPPDIAGDAKHIKCQYCGRSDVTVFLDEAGLFFTCRDCVESHFVGDY